EAAVAAGSLIREDFHRPGGARGHDDHAEVDEEAEVLIRGKLLTAFPEWGYRGEETGSANLDPPPRFIWLVDPNDGTRSYLEGYRGNAVSIALLRDREPVLGVVFAPCAPDDDGDLIAWAEGCGPVTRNGAPVAPPAWHERIRDGDCVLVSVDADNDALVNSRILAPGRYRIMPSIAYRLALAAVGDAAIGTGLKGAGDWDYAGGQALLRGNGADMFDQHGVPAVYTAEGESHCRGCFGGAQGPIRQLLSRPWREMLPRRHRHDPTGLMPPFPTLPPGRHVRDAASLRRAQGCLLGHFIGDALGSLVESPSGSTAPARPPESPVELGDGGPLQTLAGQPTDVSELALTLAHTIDRARRYDDELAARAYAYWLRSQPFRIEGATATALRAAPNISLPLLVRSADGGYRIAAAHRDGSVESVAASARAAADAASTGFGSLTRASPLGIFGHAMEPDDLASIARADSALTHPNPICQDACAVYVVAIAHAISTGAAARDVYRFALDWAESGCQTAEVRGALRNAEVEQPSGRAITRASALTALQIAFHQLLHAPGAQEGIESVVRLPGPASAHAAVAGALLGAVHGRESLPARWRGLVLTCRPVAGAPGVRRPRPEVFWPTGALEMGERLLWVGA